MNTDQILLQPYNLNGMTLQNKVVMAPMTRSRASQDHVPTEIMATYYGQRANAGLIITEGTSPSVNGAGYPRIPGIYTPAQTEGWKEVTAAAHEKGAKIFLQIMHTGRVSHPLNLDQGGQVLAPSPVAAASTEMYTDQEGMQKLPVPQEMNKEEIQHAIREYVDAAKNAIEAGFDGVEIHGANGYLIDQFLNPISNMRDDEYGGSAENRARFALEVTQGIIQAIGKEKVGIRISPNGVFNDLGAFDNQEETFLYVAGKMREFEISYIHIVDHSAMGTPEVPKELKEKIRDTFLGTIIISGGYDFESANKDLEAKLGDLVAFGRPYISNPDLVDRFKKGADLQDPDMSTFYSPGEKGYTDYPTL